jgi:hypothetical protein
MTYKIGGWVTLVTSSLLLLLSFFLLLLTWWTAKMSTFVEAHPYAFTLTALALLLIAVLSLRSMEKSSSSYTLNLTKGKATFSVQALKKGIIQFLQRENPNYQLKSLELLGGGRTLHLVLNGKEDQKEFTPLLDRLSSLLADQYGFEGQLEVSF